MYVTLYIALYHISITYIMLIPKLILYLVTFKFESKFQFYENFSLYILNVKYKNCSYIYVLKQKNESVLF